MIYTRQYLLLFLLLSKSAVANQPSDEYALKAAFIYNFTKYIDWNAKAAGDEFIIGVIGNSDILGPLRTIAGVKLVNGKKILLRHYSMIDHYEFCHVVFISKNA